MFACHSAAEMRSTPPSPRPSPGDHGTRRRDSTRSCPDLRQRTAQRGRLADQDGAPPNPSRAAPHRAGNASPRLALAHQGRPATRPHRSARARAPGWAPTPCGRGPPTTSHRRTFAKQTMPGVRSSRDAAWTMIRPGVRRSQGYRQIGRRVDVVHPTSCLHVECRGQRTDVNQLPCQPALFERAAASCDHIVRHEWANIRNADESDGYARIVFLPIVSKETAVLDDQQVLIGMQVGFPTPHFQRLVAGCNATATGRYDRQGFHNPLFHTGRTQRQP